MVSNNRDIFRGKKGELLNLLKSHSTPFLIFDIKKFKELFMNYSKFGGLYYPVKANDHKIILKEIDKLNGFFEVDGIHHINLLLSLGISPKKIQYSIPIKKESDIKRALELGVTRFVIDNSKEYKKISFFKYDVDYIIRISISDILDLDLFGFNKWGLPITNVKKLIKQIENDGNNFCGISFYLPKEIFTSTNFSIMINRIIKEFHDVNPHSAL